MTPESDLDLELIQLGDKGSDVLFPGALRPRLSRLLAEVEAGGLIANFDHVGPLDRERLQVVEAVEVEDGRLASALDLPRSSDLHIVGPRDRLHGPPTSEQSFL